MSYIPNPSLQVIYYCAIFIRETINNEGNTDENGQNCPTIRPSVR